MADTERKKTCTCGKDHQGHLCMLHSKGMKDAIACLTDKPTVMCFNCGREANSGANVCNPMPIEEK